VPPDSQDVSYRALLRIPSLGRVVASMQLARISGQMVGVALVLFTLLEYGSAPLAGIVTFASVVPGLLVSPISGALLDRHGRVRLVQLDYVASAASMLLIGILSLAGALPPWLLVAISAVASLTNSLSQTGLRSLFPIMVPHHLWERVNAVDSNGYVVATIIGPPLAAVLVASLGPAKGLILIALPMLVAAAILTGVKEPHTETASTGNLLLDAWQGVKYVAHNPTLRGIGAGMTVLNLASGAINIVVPILVLQRMHGSELAVGFAFAISGVGGMVSAFAFGRTDTRGREWRLLWLPMLGISAATLLLLPPSSGWVTVPAIAYGFVLGSMMITGLLNGPLDVAMFTMRQRRTDPAWLGRAFAVSMAINFAGYPIGAAIAGLLASTSLEAAVLLAVVGSFLSAVLCAWLVPRTDPRDVPTRRGELRARTES